MNNRQERVYNTSFGLIHSCGGRYQDGPRKRYVRCGRCGSVSYDHCEGDTHTGPPLGSGTETKEQTTMKINITKVCKDANWHLRTAIDELSKHLSQRDAEAFVYFVFADHSVSQDEERFMSLSGWVTSRLERAEDQVTDEQWDRLELDGTDWCIKED